MANIIDMPKLSDTMTTGTVIKWLKREGETVKTGDMLAEVETDKATMDLECFFDGVLLKIFTPAGANVPIGTALCAVGKAGKKVSAPAAPPASAATQAPAQPKSESPAAPAKAPAPLAPAQPAAAPAPSSDNGPRPKISPLARKLAAEKGIDPAQTSGSGPGGRIVRADILAAERTGLDRPVLTVDKSGPIQEDKLAPLSTMRSVIARRTVEAKTQVPHIYLETVVDAGPLVALRSQLNAALEREGVKLSINDFILKATAMALRRVPAVNCSWEKESVRQHPVAHVSFAVAIEDGLITPVIRDTEAKTVFDISNESKSLARLAREKKLQPAQYTGGTFCVTNLGMMGITRFGAIVNLPNAAILAVGATEKMPVVQDDQIVIGHRMALTLSCDHRLVDGAIGAQYLQALREILERPSLLLL